MGCFVSVARSQVLPISTSKNRIYEDSLRMKILEDVRMSFGDNIKMLIYVCGPPMFPTKNIAEYISQRTGFSILRPSKHDSQTSSENIDNAGYSEEESEYIQRQIADGGCNQGFVVYLSPRTNGQFNQMNSMCGCNRITVLYLDVSKQMNRLLRYRWNIWRHSPSGRLYHLLYSPPESSVSSRAEIDEAVRRGQCPNSSRLLDDVTQEPLEVISNAAYCGYLDELAQCQSSTHTAMISHYKGIGYHIECTTDIVDIQRKVLIALASVAAKEPLSGYRPVHSSIATIESARSELLGHQQDQSPEGPAGRKRARTLQHIADVD